MPRRERLAKKGLPEGKRRLRSMPSGSGGGATQPLPLQSLQLPDDSREGAVRQLLRRRRWRDLRQVSFGGGLRRRGVSAHPAHADLAGGGGGIGDEIVRDELITLRPRGRPGRLRGGRLGGRLGRGLGRRCGAGRGGVDYLRGHRRRIDGLRLCIRRCRCAAGSDAAYGGGVLLAYQYDPKLPDDSPTGVLRW